MAFCSSGPNSAHFNSECVVDGLRMVAPLLLVCAAGPSILLRWVKLRTPCHITHSRRWLRYTGHELRWILVICAVISEILLIGEGVLSYVNPRRGSPAPGTHPFIPSILCTIANIFSLFIYNLSEIHRLPRLLLVLLLYWAPCAGLAIVKLGSLLWIGVAADTMRLIVMSLIFIIYSALLLLEAYLLITMRYLSQHQYLPSPSEELPHLGYIHPYTCFLSRITWHWMVPLLSRGYKHILQMTDLGSLPQSEDIQLNFDKFKAIFEEEKELAEQHGKKLSLWKCYWRAFWPMWVLGGVCKLLADLLTFFTPMALDKMVLYVSKIQEQQALLEMNITATEPTLPSISYLSWDDFFSNGIFLAIMTFFAALLQGTFWQNHFYLSVRQGIRCKGALQAMVYDKSLRLSTFTMNEGGMSQGQIINHMVLDPINILMLMYLGHFLWSIPLQISLTFVLLYRQLGISAVIGGSIVLVLIPLQWYIGKFLGRLQEQILKFSDHRIRQSNELFQGITLLKLYSWENVFRDAVLNTRNCELFYLFQASCCRIISMMVCDTTPLIACMITFLIYPRLEGEMMPTNKVFSGLALFSILLIPLYVTALITNLFAHARVSTNRLLPFLLAPEVEGKHQNKGNKACNSHRGNKDQIASMTTPEPSKTANLLSPSEENTPERYGYHKSEILSLLSDDTSTRRHEFQSNPILAQTEHSTPVALSRKFNMRAKSLPSMMSEKRNHVAARVNSSNAIFPVLSSEVTVTVSAVSDCEVMVMKEASFSWNAAAKEVTLEDISLSVPKGKLTMVIGPVGSGKSSLLSALLNEMTTVAGDVQWAPDCRLAYGSQRAWLLNDSFRNNILFGLPYDPLRYKAVIAATALSKDIVNLPNGELTEIGEKGINLSGGQKQRISLARVLYSDSNVILLDDPFASLDVHVGGHIFKEAILSMLQEQGKTVILVTHQLAYLPAAHQIIGLEAGRVIFQGNWQELQKKQPKLLIYCQKNSEQKDDGCHAGSRHKTTVPVLQKSEISLSQQQLDLTGSISALGLTTSMGNIYDESEKKLLQNNYHGKDKAAEGEKGKLIEKEERQEGAVAGHVYLSYMKAASYYLVIITIVFFVVRQTMRCVCDIWLATWSQRMWHLTMNNTGGVSDVNTTNNTNTETPEDMLYFYTKVYIILCAVFVSCALGSISFLEVSCLIAAKNVHKNMFMALVAVPRRFFDTTPIGRIINRLSVDTSVIDQKMPVTVMGCFFCLLYVAAGLLVNTVSQPYFLLPAVLMFVIYIAVQRFYIASSRELQRLDSITKSPILAHFSQTLSGLTTIRAYGHQRRFQQQNWRNVKNNNTAFLFLHTTNVWMGIRLDYLGAFLVMTASLASVASGVVGSVPASVVGLCIAYATMICNFFNWSMRTISEAEMWFNAVERVNHYSQLPSEPYRAEDDVPPPVTWPEFGEIVFDAVSLRYDGSLDPVVHDLSIHIPAARKVGICGRTGSGKSSMMLSLFRMLDLCEGRILIDGHDISHVPLHTLRSRLSLIPQDPVLFSGTVRTNLDPEGIVPDDYILWRALEIAQLRYLVEQQDGKLDSLVTEGGDNYSAGQRQLFCLARAFLRDSRILIMDEATASVDFDTDRAIQNIMYDAFRGRTVITIAHRVSTIRNYDMILVLSEGRVIEQGAPGQLLLKKGGVFASMVHSNK